MRQAAIVLSVLAGLCLAGCGLPDDAVTDPADPSSAVAGGLSGAPHVVGGQPSAVCGFPMTAKIPGCTSTLLTPTILITAKHCGPKAGMNVQFGEKTPYAFTIKAVKCVTATDSDAAYCVLPDDDRLKNVPTVPPLHGCEFTKFMKAGIKVMGVGWGDTMGTGPRGTKNQAMVPVVRVADPLIATGDNNTDLCFGDSGGGGYIHLVEGDKDWGWRVFGTVFGTTRIPGGAACDGTSYTSVQRHIRLIEQTEKLDVTPCTDAAGKWAPGSECAGFLTDPGAGGGAWPTCMPGPRTSLPLDSCGAGPASGADGGAPIPDAGGTDALKSDGGRADVAADTGAGGRGMDAAGPAIPDAGDAGPPIMPPATADSGAAPPPFADAGGGPIVPPGNGLTDAGKGCACRAAGGDERPGVLAFLSLIGLAAFTRRRR